MLGSIVRMEFLREGRNIRLPILMIFYNAILAFVTILFLFFNTESFQEGIYYGSSPFVLQFLIISSFQIFTIFLMMPFSVAGVYVSDREKHMFEQFSMIPGVTKKIVLGKVILIISVNMMIYISSMPIITLSCIYSGLSLAKIVRLTIIILIYSIWSLGIAIFFYSISKKPMFAFGGTIFSYVFFTGGIVLISQIIRNIALSVSQNGIVPSFVTKICLMLQLFNPFSVYMGYYVNLTGNNGFMTTYCEYMGIDSSNPLFSLLFYKAAIIITLMVAITFIFLSIRFRRDGLEDEMLLS